MPIAPAVLAVAAEATLASAPRAPALAESTPFLFGAQWRVRSRVATATALADLSLSPNLMAAAKCVPEVGLAAMANAMLRRPESVERVIAAAERAAREKHAQLRQAAPDLWAKHDKVSLDSLLAILREQELKQWTEVWSASDEGELPGPLKTYSAVCNALPVRSMAPDEESSEAILGAIAAGAAAEMEALGRDLFGAEALLATRAATPEENQANAFDEAGWMLAEIERAALRNTVRASNEHGGDSHNGASEISGQNPKGPREMLIWCLPLSFDDQIQPPGSEIHGVFVGLDLAASPATQGVLRLAPHLSRFEAAASLLNSDVVAERLINRFAQAAEVAGVWMDRPFEGEDREEGKIALRKEWAIAMPLTDIADEPCRSQEVIAKVCSADADALPELRMRSGTRGAHPEIGMALGERMKKELEIVAAELFGAQAVAFVDTTGAAPKAMPMCEAYAQKMELARVVSETRAQESAAAKPRKARAL